MMDVEQWKAEIPARAARWAAEHEHATHQRHQRMRAEQQRRAAEWPIERILAVMAEVANEVTS